MINETAAADLAEARKHALLKKHDFCVNLNMEKKT